jgi:hypothetical protein
MRRWSLATSSRRSSVEPSTCRGYCRCRWKAFVFGYSRGETRSRVTKERRVHGPSYAEEPWSFGNLIETQVSLRRLATLIANDAAPEKSSQQ